MYVPAVQLVQDPPTGPIKPLDPLLHVQSLRASLPDGDDDWEGQLKHMLDVVAPEVVEYVPPAQRVQDAGPGELLYVPAMHISQGPPSGPDEPALQVQAVEPGLPDGEFDLAGHACLSAVPPGQW